MMAWYVISSILVDFTLYLNDLNSKLQGEGPFIHQSYSHIKPVQKKIQLWGRHVRNGSTFHFPTLTNHGNSHSLESREFEYSRK